MVVKVAGVGRWPVAASACTTARARLRSPSLVRFVVELGGVVRQMVAFCQLLGEEADTAISSAGSVRPSFYGGARGDAPVGLSAGFRAIS